MKRIYSSIVEVLRYYKEDSDLLLIFFVLLLQSVKFLTIILFSISMQASYNVIIQGSAIKKIAVLIPALIHLHHIYMLLDTTRNIKTIVSFYNKVIVASLAFLILTPTLKNSLFFWIDQNTFLSLIGIDTHIITFWVPTTYIMVNALFIIRTEIGPRPKTKKEYEDLSKKFEKEFKYLQSIKQSIKKK